MAAIDISSAGGGSVSTGVLQLQNGVAMDSTLRNVADQSNTTSPLKLSTSGVQVASTLQITTNNSTYLDIEDGSGNNRFTISRDPSSQQVNVDFASNPGGSTELVGGFRTYVDGTNLSNVVNIRRDGQLQIGSTAASAMYWDNTNNRVGIGTATPGVKLDVHSGADNIAQLNRTGAGKSLLQYLLTGTARWATGFDNTNGNYTIYDAVNATDRVVVTNTGRLGVGTSAPNSLLNVIGTGGVSGIRVNTSGADSWMPFSDGNWYIRSSGTIINDNSSGGVSIGVNSPTTARLFVKGNGSTSATTSLLVQNSSALEALKITDDGTSVFKSATGTLGQLNANGDLYFGVNNNAQMQILNTASTIIARSPAFLFRNDGGPTGQYYANFTGGQFAIGKSTTQAVASALIEMSSTTMGFLPPRMTNAQRAAITTPAIGLMVYCTDVVEGIYVYKSTGWTFVA